MIFSQYEKFGKYVLLDRIAVGGMAEVYRGKLTGEKGFEKTLECFFIHAGAGV